MGKKKLMEQGLDNLAHERYDEAIEDFKQVIALQTNHWKAHGFLALSYLAQSTTQDYFKLYKHHLDNCLSESSNPELRQIFNDITAVTECLRTSKFLDFRTPSTSLDDLNSEPSELKLTLKLFLLIQLAQFYLKAGRPYNALTILEKYESRNNFEIFEQSRQILLAQAYVCNGVISNYPKAIQIFDAAYDQNPDLDSCFQKSWIMALLQLRQWGDLLYRFICLLEKQPEEVTFVEAIFTKIVEIPDCAEILEKEFFPALKELAEKSKHTSRQVFSLFWFIYVDAYLQRAKNFERYGYELNCNSVCQQIEPILNDALALYPHCVNFHNQQGDLLYLQKNYQEKLLDKGKLQESALRFFTRKAIEDAVSAPIVYRS